MDFIDESKIYIKAGNGGDGCCSFRREKFVPRGGPDGGDGGKGGDIVLRSSPHVHTLLDQRYHPHYKSERGQHGKGKNRTGRSGKDRIIKVPVGTVVRDLETGRIIADLVKVDQSIIIGRGGSGGKGNARFATSTLQAPRYCEKGSPGQERTYFLELKLLADVGLVGFPNAGKSTLISKISNARPKVANYPFTTLTPNLGMVRWKETDFVVADIPGIIEGAHTGTGLGIKFLRHIERTKIIVFVIDMISENLRDPIEELDILRNELGSYSEGLLKRKQIVLLNKCDLYDASQRSKEAVAFIKDKGYLCLPISALTGQGIETALDELVRVINEGRFEESSQEI